MPRKKQTAAGLREAVRARMAEPARDVAKALGMSVQRVYQLRSDIKQETAAPAVEVTTTPQVWHARKHAGTEDLTRENARLRALLQAALADLDIRVAAE
jgi:hypothetical protein